MEQMDPTPPLLPPPAANIPLRADGPWSDVPVDWIDAPPPRPPRPRVWTVFVALLAVFVLINALGAVLFVVFAIVHTISGGGRQPDLDELSADPLVLFGMLVLSVVATITVTLASASFSPVPMVQRLRLGPSNLGLPDYAALLLGTVALAVLNGAMIQLIAWGEDAGTLGTLNEALIGLPAWAMVVAVLLLSVGPGVGEEMFFRGYVQSRLNARWGMLMGIGVSTLLFALFHIHPLHVVAVVALGAYFGYVAARAGSIRPAIACHMFNNLFAGVGMIAANDPDIYFSQQSHEEIGAGFVAALVVVLLLCLFYFHHRTRAADAAGPIDPPAVE